MNQAALPCGQEDGKRQKRAWKPLSQIDRAFGRAR